MLKLACLAFSRSGLNFSTFVSYLFTQSGPRGDLTALPFASFNTPPAKPFPKTAWTIRAAAFSAPPGCLPCQPLELLDYRVGCRIVLQARGGDELVGTQKVRAKGAGLGDQAADVVGLELNGEGFGETWTANFFSALLSLLSFSTTNLTSPDLRPCGVYLRFLHQCLSYILTAFSRADAQMAWPVWAQQTTSQGKGTPFHPRTVFHGKR